MRTDQERNASMMMDWLDHCRSQWAWLDVDEIVNGDPEKAWSFLRDMIDITPEASLGAVGAGPLESFVHQNAKAFIERIEEAAATDPKFRQCLDTIYFFEPKGLAQRVKGALAAPTVKQRPRTGSISKARARIVTAWLHHSDTQWATDYLTDLIDSDPYTAIRLIESFANILAKEGDTDTLDDLSLHAFDKLIDRHGPAVHDDVILIMQRSSTIHTWVLSRQNGRRNSPAWEELLRRIP